MTTMTYTEWLAEGQKNVTGKVGFPDKSSGARYAVLQADLFPEFLIFFSTMDWSRSKRETLKTGSHVVFDLPPQEVCPGHLPIAQNVRLVRRPS